MGETGFQIRIHDLYPEQKHWLESAKIFNFCQLRYFLIRIQESRIPVDPDTKHWKTSVVDPDPYCFGPPGSGSVIFCTYPDLDLNLDLIPWHQQVQKIRKTVYSNILWLLFDFLSLKNDVNVPSIISIKTLMTKTTNLLFAGILSATDEASGSVAWYGSGFVRQWYAVLRIRSLFDPWIRDPEWVFFRIPDLGSRIPNPYFWELCDNIFR